MTEQEQPYLHSKPIEKRQLRDGDDLMGRTFLLQAIPTFYEVLHQKPQLRERTRQTELGYWYACTSIKEFYRLENDHVAYDIEYEAEGKEDKRIMVTRMSVGLDSEAEDDQYAVLSMSTAPTPNETLSSTVIDYQIDYNGPTDTSSTGYLANDHDAEVQSLKMLAELRSFVPTRLVME